MQRQLSFNHRPNIRCFRCNNFGHYARECPVRGNRRNRHRGQSNYSRNNQGAWGSHSYDMEWPNSVNMSNSPDVWDNVWGAASAPAPTSDWSNITFSPTVDWGTGDTAQGNNTTNPIHENSNNSGWGADGWTTSNREWPTIGETTSFEFTLSLSDNEDEEHESHLR